MSAKDKFKELKKTLEDAQEAARKEGKILFKEACIELFDENPALTSFGWNQYTPYFNDGDSCDFSVDVDYPNINGVEGYKIDDWEYYKEEEDDDDEDVPTEEKSILPIAELKRLQNIVGELLAQIPEDVLESLFGDHMTITVPRKGTITTEEYEHD